MSDELFDDPEALLAAAMLAESSDFHSRRTPRVAKKERVQALLAQDRIVSQGGNGLTVFNFAAPDYLTRPLPVPVDTRETAHCLYCTMPIIPPRKSKKFCSAKCRVYNSRKSVTTNQ